jgi:hypothetical protein
MRAKRRLIADFRLTFVQFCVDLHIASYPFGLALFAVSSSGAIGC